MGLIFTSAYIKPHTKYTLCNPAKYPIQAKLYYKICQDGVYSYNALHIRNTPETGYTEFITDGDSYRGAPWALTAEATKVQKIYIETDIVPTNMNNWFSYMNIKSIEGFEKIDVCAVIMAENLFGGSVLEFTTKNNILDLSDWYFESCVDIIGMFNKTTFAVPIKMFGAKRIQDAAQMFKEAKTLNQNVSLIWNDGLDLSKANVSRFAEGANLPTFTWNCYKMFALDADLPSMFSEAATTLYLENYRLSNDEPLAAFFEKFWTFENTLKLQFGPRMFRPNLLYDLTGLCDQLISPFDITYFDCKVVSLKYAFYNATLTGQFNMDLSECVDAECGFGYTNLEGCDMRKFKIGGPGAYAIGAGLFQGARGDGVLQSIFSEANQNNVWFLGDSTYMFENFSTDDRDSYYLPNIRWESNSTDVGYWLDGDRPNLEHIYVHDNFALPPEFAEGNIKVMGDCPKLHNYTNPITTLNFVIDNGSNNGVLEVNK